MYEIAFGVVAIAGGLGYVAMVERLHRLLGIIPILVFVAAFGAIRSGTSMGFFTLLGIEFAAAVLGAVLFSRGRMEKVRRAAEEPGD